MANPKTPNDVSPNAFEQAGIWCARVAESPLDSAEQAAFETWLDESDDHQMLFETALAHWTALDAVSGSPEVIRHRQKALASYRAAQRQRWQGQTRFFLWLSGGMLAASILGAIVWFGQQPVKYQTGPGDRQIVALSDGSRMALDAATRLEVAYRPDRRDIRLIAGRASFTVAHDASRPFSVAVGNETVVATGTEFSVEKLSRQLRVVLYEGHVRVLADVHGQQKPELALTPDGRAAPADTLLTPGKQLIVFTETDAPVIATGQILEASEVSPKGWEGGQLDFDNEALSVAAERVNRYARDTKVIVSPDAADIRVSGTFDAGDTAAFAAGVSAAFPVRETRMNGQIALFKKVP